MRFRPWYSRGKQSRRLSDTLDSLRLKSSKRKPRKDDGGETVPVEPNRPRQGEGGAAEPLTFEQP